MWTPCHQLLWISGSAALLSAVASAQQFSGDMTSYTLSSPSSGNCNFMAAPAGAMQNYAALNGAQWDSTKNCGRCAEVSCGDSRCKDTTKSEIVYILDQCPECKSGDLDVSPSVFKSLTGSDPSRYKINWKFVDCPVPGNLKYCLKSGSNAYYAAVQPANAAAGVKSVTINSQATTMVPSAYYYLLESNINLSSVKVSVTSLSGETVTETVALKVGACTDGTSQFTVSGSAPASPAVTPSATPAATTKAPVSPTPPTARPNPTTKRPSTTAPTPTKTTRAPPRTETTKTPSPSAAADSDTDNGEDDDDDKDDVTTAPAPAAPSATTAATTVAPASPVATTVPASPASSSAPATTEPAVTTAPVSTTPATAAPSPASTTKAPVAPSTPSPTKKVSCRRLED